VLTLEGKMAEIEVDLETVNEENTQLKRQVESNKAEAETNRDKLKRALEDMDVMKQEHEQELRRLKELGGRLG